VCAAPAEATFSLHRSPASTPAGGVRAAFAAAPAATRTPAATATQSPTPTATAELARATSERECARLWNEDALDPDSYQVTANEFVAELAPVRVHVAHQNGDCFVVAPIAKRRIAIFTAADGRRPFTVPTRRKLRRGERIPSTPAPIAKAS
jgi:hypothetical protein